MRPRSTRKQVRCQQTWSHRALVQLIYQTATLVNWTWSPIEIAFIGSLKNPRLRFAPHYGRRRSIHSTYTQDKRAGPAVAPGPA